jgi:hypothetical protein
MLPPQRSSTAERQDRTLRVAWLVERAMRCCSQIGTHHAGRRRALVGELVLLFGKGLGLSRRVGLKAVHGVPLKSRDRTLLAREQTAHSMAQI